MVFDINHPTASLEDDARTFLILKDIANIQDPDIQMEVDYPSVHENKRLPVLDLGVFVVNNKIQFGFYSKKMTSPYVNMYISAISAKTKGDSLLQEGLRRSRNMSDGIGEYEKKDTLSRFMNTLRISGYDNKYRFQLLKGILDRKKQIDTEIQAGTRVRYRSRIQIQSNQIKSLTYLENIQTHGFLEEIQ